MHNYLDHLFSFNASYASRYRDHFSPSKYGISFNAIIRNLIIDFCERGIFLNLIHSHDFFMQTKLFLNSYGSTLFLISLQELTEYFICNTYANQTRIQLPFVLFEMTPPCMPLCTFKIMRLPPLLVTPYRATHLECSNTFVLSRVN
jgi:hypothetical protein